VRAGFAHRRKTLLKSLRLAGSKELESRARAALDEGGHPRNVRAEQLEPLDFAKLAETLKPWL
jgi:16S rRNA A1518/A1519 N6-dimethyltransferase RsmA/KsgA/DIM1 with predicted DNA glycosylase/AP lyase activity